MLHFMISFFVGFADGFMYQLPGTAIDILWQLPFNVMLW